MYCWGQLKIKLLFMIATWLSNLIRWPPNSVLLGQGLPRNQSVSTRGYFAQKCSLATKFSQKNSWGSTVSKHSCLDHQLIFVPLEAQVHQLILYCDVFQYKRGLVNLTISFHSTVCPKKKTKIWQYPFVEQNVVIFLTFVSNIRKINWSLHKI